MAAWRWMHRPARNQATVIFAALSLMAIDDLGVWTFGVWVLAAYVVDIVGDDAAPGTLLAASALFYPLIELGFNSWWCQFFANMFGLAALGVISGVGGGIFGHYRYSRRCGVDILGRVWGGGTA